jgi:outer membrane protein assembly factor BamB
MPRPDDLPAPLTPLAHLNAIEIFDQLFPDSVRHLESVLRPLVHPLPRYWRWTGPGAGRLRVSVLTLVLLVAVGVAGIVSSTKRSTDDTRKGAPLASETLAGKQESGPSYPPVKIRTSSNIEELPPVIEASRKVMMPGSSSQVAGPVKPGILWRAKVTVGDAWHVAGIAADGTVYVYDDESHVLDAIRDGKEQWAFDFTGADIGISPDFASDGRIWLGDYCFNSRGEGGRVTRKKLLPDRATLMPLQRQESPYECRGGKVSPSGSDRRWAFELDGNCGSQQPTALPSTGNIYAFSDLGTLYAITRDGRLAWSVQQACKSGYAHGYPLPDDELIVACENGPIHTFRKGSALWTAAIFASGDPEPIFDGSGNIYFGNTALDKSGKQVWKLSAAFTPVGFDSQGRLYGSVEGDIVSLSR